MSSKFITISPDGYSRYFWIMHVLQLLLADKKQTVLDVGGRGTFLDTLFREASLPYELTVIDPLPTPKDVPYRYVRGDGTQMIFDTNSFDAVISTDVLEHVPEEKKILFIQECIRVASKVVVIAFPDDSKRVDEAEHLANDFYLSITGRDHRWLKEHFAMKKPSIRTIVTYLDGLGYPYEILGTNNLDNWLLTVLANFIQEKYPAHTEALEQLNRFYNENIMEVGDLEGPSYRKMLIIYKKRNQKTELVEQIRKSTSSQKLQQFRAKYVAYFGDIVRDYVSAVKTIESNEYSAEYQEKTEQLLAAQEMKLYDYEIRVSELEAQLNHRAYELHTVRSELANYRQQLARVQSTFLWRVMHSKKLPIYYLHELYRTIKARLSHRITLTSKDMHTQNSFFGGTGPQAPSIIYERQRQEYLNWRLFRKKNQKAVPLKGFHSLFSIVTPVYNTNPSHLEQCINSVRKQTYKNWEHILVNDASTNEDTIRTLNQLAKEDKRIRVVHLRKNRGIAGATNEGIRHATGSYICFLDHDDMLDRNALAENAAAFLNDGSVSFTFSDKDLFEDSPSSSLNPLFKPQMSEVMMLSANYLTHFTVLKKELVDAIGELDTETDGAQDWDYYLRAIATGAKFYRIPKILYHWRIHATSTSSGINAKPYAQKNQMCALTKYCESKRYIAHGALEGHKNKIAFIPEKNEAPVAIHLRTSRLKYSQKLIQKIINISNYRNFTIAVHGLSEEVVGITHPRISYSASARHSALDFSYLRSEGSPFAILLHDTLVPDSPYWIDEVIGFLRIRPDFRAATGKIILNSGTILGTIRQLRERAVINQFDKYPDEYIGIIGSSEWYWEMAAPAPLFLAIPQHAYGHFVSVKNWEDYFRVFVQKGFKELTAVYNPFARMRCIDEKSARSFANEPAEIDEGIYRSAPELCEKMLHPEIAYTVSEKKRTPGKILIAPTYHA
ncbi:MAG: glycosyltransferase [Patescibacteria group bacterium]|nr:glycosyltransferase [Patescibacteria group bacterium]